MRREVGFYLATEALSGGTYEPDSLLHKGISDASLKASAGIVLTNDGNAILREIDVSHPAAKVRSMTLINLSPSVLDL